MAFKYNEDKILAEAMKYIQSTYKQHYVDNNQTQLIDLFDVDTDDINELIGFFRINAIKYLKRFGKKDGFNRKDMMKAIHYTVLLTHITAEKQEAKPEGQKLLLQENKS